MEYNFKKTEKKWQKYWADDRVYKTEIDKNKPKYYVLDMFPYPSGAGLHVGHPLGYIASDIFSRYKRLKGYNVLHPMGYDAYGLPAEQYAIQTGQHPAITTENNIKKYREQLDKIGFCYDWDREVRTCDPRYYKWTQWVFLQMFQSYFDRTLQKARSISQLINELEINGTQNINVAQNNNLQFTSKEWKNKTKKEQQEILMNFRLAYISYTTVNWCSKLGTVLANDEVKEGYSVRGGYPVEQKKMKQWFLRVSAYSKRLLDGLENVNWSDSLKEIQRNWIGRSQGAELIFRVKNNNVQIKIFTTRPDTIFGVTFMVIAPDSNIVQQIMTPEYHNEINNYILSTKKKSERERIANTKTVSGQFTGTYAIHPFTQETIPIYISDYVLAEYGTGAIMAVPAHDSRDYAFAQHFDLPIIQVIMGGNVEQEAYDAKKGELMNSHFINGMQVKEAIQTVCEEVEKQKIGKQTINYRLRDAIFSRQRYWGEPFPIFFKEEMPYSITEKELPIKLPKIDKFLPTETGEPPLGRAENWKTQEGYPIDLNTMPGFAGSSAYYLRYMDTENNNELVSKEANEYWQDVDLYIGGTEHATGHLIYSRFWNKFLYDIEKICKDEPFKKLINQGMIQGRSNYVYRIKNTNTFVSKGLKATYHITDIHVDISIVKNDILNIEAFKNWRPEFKNAKFILEDGTYHCGYAIEKMSKSMFNVVNPDTIIEKYGADTLRLYEMFLGPIEQSKPWNTNGIDGVSKFLNKLWRLFFNNKSKIEISEEKPNDKENKIIHKTIKKIQEDIERFAFNTSISAFMICVNELTDLKCNKRKILEPLLIILSPFAPHISQELWNLLGNKKYILDAIYPQYEDKYLQENSYSYPVSFNGKMRFKIDIPLNLRAEEVEKIVLTNENTQNRLKGKTPQKVIVVPNKIINIVVH